MTVYIDTSQQSTGTWKFPFDLFTEPIVYDRTERHLVQSKKLTVYLFEPSELCTRGINESRIGTVSQWKVVGLVFLLDVCPYRLMLYIRARHWSRLGVPVFLVAWDGLKCVLDNFPLGILTTALDVENVGSPANFFFKYQGCGEEKRGRLKILPRSRATTNTKRIV